MSDDMKEAGTGHARFRKGILRAGIVFLVMLLFLTFFSKTLLNLTLPRVAATEPTSGPLLREIRAEGTITATARTELYVNARVRVHAIRIQVGDSVKEGQVLAILDAGDMQAELDTALSSYARGKGKLSDLYFPIATARLKTLDGAIDIARMKVESLNTRLETVKSLQARGSETMDSVSRARMDLTQASQDLAERQEARDQRMDVILQQLESAVIVATSDAVIAGVNGETGAWVDSSQPIVTLLPRGAGLSLKVTLPTDLAKLVSVGESVDVTATTGAERTATGRLLRIAENPTAGGGVREVTISLPRDSDLRAGDKGEIAIQEQTRPYPLLVPNAAVGGGGNDKFVWILKERSGAFGTEYSVIKSSVTVDDSDDFMSAISNGLDPTEKVVTRSSKPIAEPGGRVVLE